MKRLMIIPLIFIVACFWACQKAGSGDNGKDNGNGGDTDNEQAVIYNRAIFLVGQNGGATGNGGFYDIMGDGKTYMLLSGSVSPFSYMGSRGNSNGFVGSGANAYKDVNFDINTDLIVEVLDTTISRECDQFTFVKAFPLANYDQATFKLPQSSYSKFANSAYLSFFNYSPSSSCVPNSFIENPFDAGGYFIFRIRNKRTNKSNYGWGNVSVGSRDNYVTSVGFREVAYSTKPDVLLAPGYH